MTISLYDATVPSYLQELRALSGLLTKAEQFCAEKGVDPASIIEARLAHDMFAFDYQVKSAVVHSLGAIEGVRKGSFSPDMSVPPATFAAQQDRVAEAIAALEAIDPAEMETFIGRDMEFRFGERVVPYTAENFLLSFSQPNFYFHVTTAYAILRWQGVQVGKRDYIGKPRTKQPA